MSGPLQMKFHDGAVRRSLQTLPAKVNESIRKKAMREALKPAVDDLRKAWKSAHTRRRRTFLKSIASATKADVRRVGADLCAPIRGRVGVVYGAKGGKRAGGRQKLFHILEGGFKHYGSSPIYGLRGAHADRKKKADVIKLTASSKRVAGRRISETLSRAMMPRIMRSFAGNCLRLARAHLKGAQ